MSSQKRKIEKAENGVRIKWTIYKEKFQQMGALESEWK